MSVYTENSLIAQRKANTTFRAEGGYITFYAESDYTAGKARSAMTPLGTYLFINGVTVNETIQEHQAVQGFGSDYENLYAPSLVKSTLNVNGLYVQEGADPAWMAAGHPDLMAFIDFFMPMKSQANDTVNANGDIEQTIVVRNLRVASKTIAATDANGVTYALNFNGGRVTRLANTTMDLP